MYTIDQYLVSIRRNKWVKKRQFFQIQTRGNFCHSKRNSDLGRCYLETVVERNYISRAHSQHFFLSYVEKNMDICPNYIES